MKRSLILLVLLTIFSGAAWSIWEFRHATIPVTDIDVMKKVEYKKHTNDEKIFWIDKYEVTNGQYWRWDESLDFPESKVDFPVTNIDWYQAMAYAKHVGKRLPSQEEWLIAAHATPRMNSIHGILSPVFPMYLRLAAITFTVQENSGVIEQRWE